MTIPMPGINQKLIPPVLVGIRLRDFPDRSLGHLYAYRGENRVAEFKLLELPDRENKQNISRIPAGKYRVRVEKDDHYGLYLRIISPVPGRERVLVHFGCFPRNTRGCLLVGMIFADLDSDGLPDINATREAVDRLCSIVGPVGSEADLFIFDADR